MRLTNANPQRYFGLEIPTTINNLSYVNTRRRDMGHTHHGALLELWHWQLHCHAIEEVPRWGGGRGLLIFFVICTPVRKEGFNFKVYRRFAEGLRESEAVCKSTKVQDVQKIQKATELAAMEEDASLILIVLITFQWHCFIQSVWHWSLPHRVGPWLGFLPKIQSHLPVIREWFILHLLVVYIEYKYAMVCIPTTSETYDKSKPSDIKWVTLTVTIAGFLLGYFLEG